MKTLKKQATKCLLTYRGRRFELCNRLFRHLITLQGKLKSCSTYCTYIWKGSLDTSVNKVTINFILKLIFASTTSAGG